MGKVKYHINCNLEIKIILCRDTFFISEHFNFKTGGFATPFNRIGYDTIYTARQENIYLLSEEHIKECMLIQYYPIEKKKIVANSFIKSIYDHIDFLKEKCPSMKREVETQKERIEIWEKFKRELK